METKDLTPQVQVDPIFHNINSVPRDHNNAVMHLGVIEGQVHNRVLSVGSPKRAELLSHLFDKDAPIQEVHSARGLVTYSGLFNKVPISIIATGVGVPMIDLVVREARAVVSGPMAVIRLGTCGGISRTIVPGSVVVCTPGSVGVTCNYDRFYDTSNHEDHYHFSPLLLPDAEICSSLVQTLKTFVDPQTAVLEGLNFSADTFYASEGRTDDNFGDHNEKFFESLYSKYPEATTLEMETYHLLHLCHVSHVPIRGASAVICILNRFTGVAVNESDLHKTELEAGRAVLTTLSSLQL